MCKFTFECLFWKHLYSFQLEAISMSAREKFNSPEIKL